LETATPLHTCATRCSALYQVDLAECGIRDRAVRELARQDHAVDRVLSPDQLARLARGDACARGLECLLDDRLRDRRVLLEEARQLVVDNRLDRAAHLGVAELRLGLPLELRLAHLHAQHARQSLTEVLT